MLRSLSSTPFAWLVAATALLLADPARALSDPAEAPPCPADAPGSGMYFLCFDDLASLTATSAASLPFVSVVDATVFSEADAASALGLDTSSWATSGDQGILNSLVRVVEFAFAPGVTQFGVDVLALTPPPGSPVVVQGLRGGSLLDTRLSSVSGVPVGGSDAVRVLLERSSGYDRVRLFLASGPCSGADCQLDPNGLFFADTVKFTVPEPRIASLLGLAGIGLMTARRRGA